MRRMWGDRQTIATCPPSRAQPLDRPEQHAERHRVDERRVGEVDDQTVGAVVDRIPECLTQCRRSMKIGLPVHGDQADRCLEQDALDPEVVAVDLCQGSLLVAHHCTNALPGITGAQTWCNSLLPFLGPRGGMLALPRTVAGWQYPAPAPSKRGPERFPAGDAGSLRRR